MNKKISEFLKKLNISILLLIFSFVLLTPTANALNYDPKLRKSVIKPNGDTNPWEEQDVIEPPPGDNTEYELFTYKEDVNIFIITLNSFFRWNFNFFYTDISKEKVTSRKSDIDNRTTTDRQYIR